MFLRQKQVASERDEEDMQRAEEEEVEEEVEADGKTMFDVKPLCSKGAALTMVALTKAECLWVAFILD
jgi:hypothetical protein